MLLLLAPGAVADQTYGDALGDATNGAPDITAIEVTNDAAGWITFNVRASGLPQGDTFLLLSINADANTATGRSGDDFAVVLEGGSLASIGERWDGTTWAG